MNRLTHRLLPALQLARMTLVFTALADSGCAMLLWAADQSKQNGLSVWRQITVGQCLALMMVSIGLYGFGMSLNDIIDRRRDRQMSPQRPLPSGRIGLAAAHIVSATLVLVALVGGEAYSNFVPKSHLSLILVAFTAGLITFYDFAAKYLVAPGLLSLGLIRFFHASIAAPGLPMVWQPLLLLNHMTLMSTAAYAWSRKRPILRPIHWWSIVSGLLGVNLFALGLVWLRRHQRDPTLRMAQILTLQRELIIPFAAAGVFVLIAAIIRLRAANRREAGRILELVGLLWLIVYDAAFAGVFAGVWAGVAIAMLLPAAYVSVLTMRGWSKVLLLSQRPEFKRVEV